MGSSIHPDVLYTLQRAIQKEKIMSFLIIRDGETLFRYHKNKKIETKLQKLNSCTKSVISALIGIALEQGAIADLDTPIKQYFPYQYAKLDDARKRDITIRHLLEMTPGYHWPEFGEWQSFSHMKYASDQVRFVLERPLTVNPGEQMNYNSGCSHLLSAILQKSTGMTAAAYAKKHLFAPLGISEVHWYQDSKGISNGGDGLVMTAEAMARFGTLYLNGGKWQGQQIVPGDWVRESTQARFFTYERIGHYGYHWWVNWIDPAREDVSEENRYYFALGFGGQYIIVVPRAQMVVVVTSEMYEASLRPMQMFREMVLPGIVGSSSHLNR
ncbi:serine hydrolase domain-containing protein [Brevibacillus dissolubilis]|uniref:serine hydrolase domain-containing protein n=1 Tax=Brevibacillus dissolubilis TaxID=1844116 RepID=UPI0021006198|nr:serine hydrolase [Brevibacillus dissolubilis]